MPLDHLTTSDCGVERSTGCLPRNYRIDAERIPVYSAERDSTPVIPRAEWKTQPDKRDYERRDIYQNGYPSCCPCATARAIELLLALSGRADVEIDWYAAWKELAPRGGGVALDDAIVYAMTKGFPVKGSKLRVVVTEAFDCPDIESVASAVQRGFAVTFGYFVPGGHAECAETIVVEGNAVTFRVRNSWGLDWGDKGRHLVDEAKITRGIATFGAFAIREIQLRAEDTTNLPDAKG